MSTTDETEPTTAAAIETGLYRVALAMKRAGKRGEVYLPVYERLEAELAALKARQSAMTTEDEDKPHKHTVPLKDRLSLSPEGASALTGIGLTSIRQATYSGALVARKHGKKTVILPMDLKAWLEAMPMMTGRV